LKAGAGWPATGESRQRTEKRSRRVGQRRKLEASRKGEAGWLTGDESQRPAQRLSRRVGQRRKPAIGAKARPEGWSKAKAGGQPEGTAG